MSESKTPISIYAEAYFNRVCDHLAEDFRAVSNVLGNDAFKTVVAQYLLEYPTASFTVGDIGMHLPAFLKTCPETAKIPYLADLANFEWMLLRAIYATHSSPLASVQFLESEWPLEELNIYWKAPMATHPVPQFTRAMRYFVVYQQHHLAKVRETSAEEYGALKNAAELGKIDPEHVPTWRAWNEIILKSPE